MHSDALAALRDVEYHIDLATQPVAGLDYEAFGNDIRTVFAVTGALKLFRRRPGVSRMR
jgi:hypothetical protein